MARANLGALLGNLDDNAVATPPVAAKTRPASTNHPEAAEANESAAVGATKRSALQPVAPPEPTYLRFVRKETRLREDQQNQLTLHARRLNRAKTTTSARITDNTLIRVAVDLLLARIEAASGDDETSILESLNQ